MLSKQHLKNLMLSLIGGAVLLGAIQSAKADPLADLQALKHPVIASQQDCQAASAELQKPEICGARMRCCVSHKML